MNPQKRNFHLGIIPFALIALVVAFLAYQFLIKPNQAKITSLVAPEKEQPGSILGLDFGEISQTPVSPASANASVDATDVIKPDLIIQVPDYEGYAALYLANNGPKPNHNCLFYKMFGLTVKIVYNPDMIKARELWAGGEFDAVASTCDTHPLDAATPTNPSQAKFFMLTSRSTGNDKAGAKLDIKKVEDFVGKTIAYAPFGPSQTFQVAVLSTGQVDNSQVKHIQVNSSQEALNALLDNKADIAFYWGGGSKQKMGDKYHNIVTTRDIPKLIFDGLSAFEKDLLAKKESFQALYQGILITNAELKRSKKSRQKAAQLMAADYGKPYDEVFEILDNEDVTLATHGDNLDFFGFNAAYTGMTGQGMYKKSARMWLTLKALLNSAPTWSKASYTDLVKSAKFEGTNQAAAKPIIFDPVKQGENFTAFATSIVYLHFPTNGWTLDTNAEVKIDEDIVPILQEWEAKRIRITGHTDDVGSAQANEVLSKKRALSVKNYLVSYWGIDSHRLLDDGKGESQPYAKGTDAKSRKLNRRVEIEILN